MKNPALKLLLVILLGPLGTGSTYADEASKLMTKLLAPPQISAIAPFSAKVLVGPGQLYDPLIMLPREGQVWMNDDGGEEKDKGSRLVAVDPSGTISVLADIGKLLPTVGFDIAPASFGRYAGQLFSLAQARVAMPGALENHVVQRIEPETDFAASIFCTLPSAGTKKIAGFGLDARFGPAGSPFADRLYVVTIYNDAIYAVTADGRCEPFIVFDGTGYSAPSTLTFSPDGKQMLVAVSRGVFDIQSGAAPAGAIVAVSPDGTLSERIVTSGAFKPMGMAFAPAEFGAYAGELFFADVGAYQIPVPMTQAINPDGRILRVGTDAEAVVVATGFHNPIGVQFVNGKLWVTDINGDFIAGKREVPDGFVVELSGADR